MENKLIESIPKYTKEEYETFVKVRKIFDMHDIAFRCGDHKIETLTFEEMEEIYYLYDKYRDWGNGDSYTLDNAIEMWKNKEENKK